MKKRKKKVSVSHTKRRVKRRVARAKPVKRSKPMAKKKSTTWDDEPEDVEATQAEQEDLEGDEAEAEAVPAEPTTTEATDEGVYVCDSDGVAIKGVVHNKGDRVALTPEELESVQAVGVRILPA